MKNPIKKYPQWQVFKKTPCQFEQADLDPSLWIGWCFWFKKKRLFDYSFWFKVNHWAIWLMEFLLEFKSFFWDYYKI
jgi:hypothetical protein